MERVMALAVKTDMCIYPGLNKGLRSLRLGLYFWKDRSADLFLFILSFFLYIFYKIKSNKIELILRTNKYEEFNSVVSFDGKTLFHQNKDDPTQNLKSHHIGKFPPDVHGGKYHIFLYTDIIQPQVVGSSLVPMLRMINIRSDDGEAVTDVLQTPYYMELSRSTIENITIVVCDEFGNEIPFDKGIFTTSLHFRRIRQ
jgi:hypothetical protein